MSTDLKKTLQDRVARIEARRTELFLLKEPIDKELGTTYGRLNKARAALGALEIEEMQAAGVIDWKLLLDARGDNSATYRQLNIELGKYGASNMGYNMATQQRTIQLLFYKNSPERTALARQLIEAVAPAMVPNEEYVGFSLMEKTLSENGQYSLKVKSDLSAAKVICYRWGSPKDLMSGTLDEAMAYLQLNHYYKKNYKD